MGGRGLVPLLVCKTRGMAEKRLWWVRFPLSLSKIAVYGVISSDAYER